MSARPTRLWSLMLSLGFSVPSPAQAPAPACSDPTQVVQRQVEAYNAHDLDAFVASYAPNIQVRLLPADSLIIADSGAFRRENAYLQRVPAGFGVDITDRIVTGCFVIDHERLRPVGDRPARDAGAAIYQVEGRLIRRVWFVGP